MQQSVFANSTQLLQNCPWGIETNFRVKCYGLLSELVNTAVRLSCCSLGSVQLLIAWKGLNIISHFSF